MWLLKGAGLSIVFFFLASMVWLYLTLFRGRGSAAIGLNAIRGYTVQYPLYWVAFAVVLVVGCGIAYRFSH